MLNDESDLAVVLIVTSYLDASLGAMAKRAFSDSTVADKLLESPGGTLNSYISRIDIAYSIGLVASEMRKDLLIIGKLRNVIAHSHLQFSFDSEGVAKLVQQLEYLKALGELGESILNRTQGPRNRFVFTALMLSQRILVDGLSVKQFPKRKMPSPPEKGGVFI